MICKYSTDPLKIKSFKGVFSNTQISKAKRAEICWTNYPLYKAHRDIPRAKLSGTVLVKPP
jgi:hypothetical protein